MSAYDKGFYIIHFENEAPAIGSGMRVVYLHSIGRKHAKIRSASSFKSAQIPARSFRNAEPVAITKAEIKRRITRFRRFGGTVSKSIRELVQ